MIAFWQLHTLQPLKSAIEAVALRASGCISVQYMWKCLELTSRLQVRGLVRRKAYRLSCELVGVAKCKSYCCVGCCVFLNLVKEMDGISEGAHVIFLTCKKYCGLVGESLPVVYKKNIRRRTIRKDV